MEKSNQFVECPINGTRQISILSSVIPGTLGKPLHGPTEQFRYWKWKKNKTGVCRVPDRGHSAYPLTVNPARPRTPHTRTQRTHATDTRRDHPTSSRRRPRRRPRPRSIPRRRPPGPRRRPPGPGAPRPRRLHPAAPPPPHRRRPRRRGHRAERESERNRVEFVLTFSSLLVRKP